MVWFIEKYMPCSLNDIEMSKCCRMYYRSMYIEINESVRFYS